MNTHRAEIVKNNDSEGFQKDLSCENMEEINSDGNKQPEAQCITNNIVEEDKCNSHNDSTVIAENDETKEFTDSSAIIKAKQQNNDLSENECESSQFETKDNSVLSDYIALQQSITEEAHDIKNRSTKDKSEIIGMLMKQIYHNLFTSVTNVIIQIFNLRYAGNVFILITLDVIDESMLKLLALQRLNQLFPSAVDVKVSVRGRYFYLLV